MIEVKVDECKRQSLIAEKRGMFFTLGVFLLMMVVFSFVLVSYDNFKEKEKRLGDFGRMSRFYDLYFSVERMVRDIFDLYSDIDVWLIQNEDGTTDVGFKEYNGKRTEDYALEYTEKMGALKTYIEQDKNVELNMEQDEKILSLIIKPHDIRYLHDAQSGQVYLRVEPVSHAPDFNFTSYSVTIDTESILIDRSYGNSGIKWHKKSAGTFDFTVSAEDDSGYSVTRQEFIDLLNLNEFRVGVSGGSTIRVIISDSGNGEVKLWSPNIEPLVSFVVGGLEVSNEAVTVESENVIKVNFTELNISRDDYIRIA